MSLSERRGTLKGGMVPKDVATFVGIYCDTPEDNNDYDVLSDK